MKNHQKSGVSGVDIDLTFFFSIEDWDFIWFNHETHGYLIIQNNDLIILQAAGSDHQKMGMFLDPTSSGCEKGMEEQCDRVMYDVRVLIVSDCIWLYLIVLLLFEF
jgi:hypothetical protein